MDNRTIRFEDVESGEQALIVVRRSGEIVGLAVSLREGGDIEVFASKSVAVRIAEEILEIASDR